MLKSTTIYTTYKCNLNCDYCFLKQRDSNLKQRKEVMNLRTLERIIPWFIHNVYKNDDPYIILSGGECLLDFKFVCQVADLIKEASHQCKKIRIKSITTNGTILDGKIIKVLKEKNIELLFSLDGYSYASNKHRFKNKNIFTKVLKNISVYTREIGTPQIKMTIHPDRAKSMYKEILSLLKNNFTNIEISPAIGTKWNKTETRTFMDNFEHIVTLHRKMKNVGRKIRIDPIDKHIEHILKNKWNNTNCELGKEIVFTPSGEAYACTLVMHLDDKRFKNKFYLGNIRTGIDLDKMFAFKNYRICSDIQLDCKYIFPAISCTKICSAYDFETKKTLSKEQTENIIVIENYMFHKTYQVYFRGDHKRLNANNISRPGHYNLMPHIKNKGQNLKNAGGLA